MTYRALPSSDQLPRALYTAAQVREFDRLAIERCGIPGETLMERAGVAAFACLRETWPAARRVAVLVGGGNNGGDGYVVARLALEQGFEVSVLQLGDPARLQGDAALNAQRWQAAGGSSAPFDGLPRDLDVIVDAMLGTGLERDVAGLYARAVEVANAHRAPALAIDIPSGLHADSGAILGCAVRAEVTVTFIGLKQGLFTGSGPDCAGRVVFAGLEVPAAVFASTVLSARRVDWSGQGGLLQPRRRSAHKGHFGHVLVIGGNHGFGGAARLAAEAALRVGAGLVSLATRPLHVSSVLAARPEVMVHGIETADQLAPLLRTASVVAIGPGLGRDAWAQALWQAAVGSGRPLVVDADALHLLAADGLRRDDWVLTPHPGEAAAMLGLCNAEVGAQRFDAVAQLQRRYGGSVVLKGAGSLVHSGGTTPPALCTDGNPGMATGGMGDVLTGIIAGLMAQGLERRDAAEGGVCLHAAAADRAATDGERGLLPSDLVEWLRSLVNGS
ncbi:MAG: NAD(P)H-hydrate dehydratase [Gammaproteobacteria bacterium]|nr:NAD(P)H-hydrate dehydratase [Gammaproteobacteria bacterium]